MNSTIKYYFKYKNTTKDVIEIWLANPPQSHNQKVHQEFKSTPVQETVDFIDNKVSYYKLNPKETIEASYIIYLINSNKDKSSVKKISDEEEQYYLRSTSMVNINEEIKKIANQLTENIVSPKEQAKSIFDHLVKNYKYKFPPEARGVRHFLDKKKGDCGEFSFLYAALCRSIGIPCRVLIGAFTIGKHHPHVWNEVYIKDEGWITIDTGMANIVKNKPLKMIFASVRTLNWKKYFGSNEGQRIIFSIDTEHTPNPSYPEPKFHPDYNYDYFEMDKNPFYWGKDLINNKIPYFQPMYLYYHDTKPLKSKKTNNIIGLWKVQEKGLSKATLLMKHISGYSAFFLAILYFVTSKDLFSILHTFPAFLFFLSFIIRKERPALFILPTVFFGIVSIIVIIVGGLTTLRMN